MPPRRDLFRKIPASPQVSGIAVPAAPGAVIMAWGANPNHAWQACFYVCVVNSGANPITEIIIQQAQVLAGTNPFNITDAVPLPAGESRWYQMEPTPPFIQVHATSALTSLADVLISETYPLG